MILPDKLYLDDPLFLQDFSTQIVKAQLSGMEYLLTRDYMVFTINGIGVQLYRDRDVCPHDVVVEISLHSVNDGVFKVYTSKEEASLINNTPLDELALVASYISLARSAEKTDESHMRRWSLKGFSSKTILDGRQSLTITRDLPVPYTFPTKVQFTDVTSRASIDRLLSDKMAEGYILVSKDGEVYDKGVTDNRNGILMVLRDMGF